MNCGRHCMESGHRIQTRVCHWLPAIARFDTDVEMDQLVQAVSAIDDELGTEDRGRTRTGSSGTMDEAKWGVVKRIVAANGTTTDIAIAVGISERSARRYRAMAEQGGLPVFNKGRTKAPNIVFQECIRGLLANNNCLTLKNIRELLPANAVRSPSTICRAIRNIGLTRKRVKPVVVARNEAHIIEARWLYSIMIRPIPDDRLVFVDECGFNLHVAPHYGYAPRGSDAHVIVPTQRGTNLSLLMAIDIAGIVSWEFQSGAYNALLFAQWCRANLFPRIHGRNMTVIMDNARFHHSPGVRNAFEEGGIQLKYLAAYSPQLNPIENVFGVLKTQYRSLPAFPKTWMEQVIAVTRLIQRMQTQQLCAFFSEMRLWCDRAAQRRHFL